MKVALASRIEHAADAFAQSAWSSYGVALMRYARRFFLPFSSMKSDFLFQFSSALVERGVYVRAGT